MVKLTYKKRNNKTHKKMGGAERSEFSVLIEQFFENSRNKDDFLENLITQGNLKDLEIEKNTPIKMLNDFVRNSHFIRDKRRFRFRLEKNKENFNLKSLLNYLLINSKLNKEKTEIIKKMIKVCITYESFISVNVSYNNNNSSTYNSGNENSGNENSGNENNNRKRSAKKVQEHFRNLGRSMDGWNPRGNHNYEAP